MKTFLDRSVFVGFLIVAVLGCGGATGDPPAFSLSSQPSLSQAIAAFVEVLPILDTNMESSCDCGWPEISCVCACAGGGDVTVRATEDLYDFVITFKDCVASDGSLFSGTLTGEVDETLDDAGLDDNKDNRTIVYDLAAFGACTDLTGTVVVTSNNAEGADACAGTLHASCGGETSSCDMTADCSSCQ